MGFSIPEARDPDRIKREKGRDRKKEGRKEKKKKEREEGGERKGKGRKPISADFLAALSGAALLCRARLDTSKLAVLNLWVQTLWGRRRPFHRNHLSYICISDVMIHTITKLQLTSSNENNFMVGGHHNTRNCIKWLQHYEG